ncbi:MAG: GIY-YIG nuclease family protein [Patescibacteria group bacterium]
MKFYFTYVLRSLVDNNLYIGWTDNLKVRLTKHNRGLVLSTKLRKPFTLVYFEACREKVKAIEREKQLKTGFGRAYLKRRVYFGRSYNGSTHPSGG